MKKKVNFNQEMAIRGANRRLFARSPLVIKKLEESRQEFPRYKKDGSRHKKNWVKRQCEVCCSWVSSSKITVDHIDPVVPPDGFLDSQDIWERIMIFLKRLWCDISNLQRICDDCHNKKTQSERIFRLNKKYMSELDILENSLTTKQVQYKDVKKTISKYISKKKIAGLDGVVQRARAIKNTFEKT